MIRWESDGTVHVRAPVAPAERNLLGAIRPLLTPAELEAVDAVLASDPRPAADELARDAQLEAALDQVDDLTRVIRDLVTLSETDPGYGPAWDRAEAIAIGWATGGGAP